MALGSQMTVPIGPGGTAFSNVTGLPEYQSDRIVGYGQDLVDKEGRVVAEGRDRPGSLGNSLERAAQVGAANVYFNPEYTSAERAAALASVPDFLRSFPGGGMPKQPLPIIPGTKRRRDYSTEPTVLPVGVPEGSVERGNDLWEYPDGTLHLHPRRP